MFWKFVSVRRKRDSASARSPGDDAGYRQIGAVSLEDPQARNLILDLGGAEEAAVDLQDQALGRCRWCFGDGEEVDPVVVRPARGKLFNRGWVAVWVDGLEDGLDE